MVEGARQGRKAEGGRAGGARESKGRPLSRPRRFTASHVHRLGSGIALSDRTIAIVGRGLVGRNEFAYR